MQLPQDVAIEILHNLPKPDYPKFTHSTHFLKPHDPQALHRYHQDKAVLANIRLTSKTFHALSTPLFYSETVVNLLAPPSAAGLKLLFSAGGVFIHTLIVDAGAYGDMGSNIAQIDLWYCRYLPHRHDLVQMIQEGLATCVHLRTLEVYGDHRLFPSRNWIKNPNTQNLDLQSIVFSSRQHLTLPYCLVGFGPRLESLTIIAEEGFKKVPLKSFHLPSSFPNLRFLHLEGWLHAQPQLKKLLSRICIDQPFLSGRHSKIQTSPLRELVVTGDLCYHGPRRNRPASFIEDVLPEVIGQHLTTLHFLPIWLIAFPRTMPFGMANQDSIPPSQLAWNTINKPMDEVLETITKKCPNLITLSLPCSKLCYGRDTHTSTRKLRDLSVFVANRESPEALLKEHQVEFKHPSLQTLSIFSLWSEGETDDNPDNSYSIDTQHGTSGQVEAVLHPHLPGFVGIRVTFIPGEGKPVR